MQCERDQCALNRIECALPRSGFKPVRMRFDFLCSVNAPLERKSNRIYKVSFPKPYKHIIMYEETTLPNYS